MKTYQVYRSIELRATVEAEDEVDARVMASTLKHDQEGVEIENEDWSIIT